MANNKSGLHGPSDLGSIMTGKPSHHAPFSNPNPVIDTPQAVGPCGGYKVFCPPGDYKNGKGAHIQGVSAADLAAEAGPGSSVGSKGPGERPRKDD